MKLYKILAAFVLTALILWLGLFLFVQYKTDAFIRKFSSDEVQISYEKLYVLPELTHISVIIKNMKAVADGVVFNNDIDLSLGFSRAVAKMNLSVNHEDDLFAVPMIVTTKKSENGNFYLETFNIKNASVNLNGASIEVNGGIEFAQASLPLGGYDIQISDAPKFLQSSLLRKYPSILHKIRKILSMTEGNNPKFRLDYTAEGMRLNGIPVEKL